MCSVVTGCQARAKYHGLQAMHTAGRTCVNRERKINKEKQQNKVIMNGKANKEMKENAEVLMRENESEF
jgi:hypothetical protein